MDKLMSWDESLFLFLNGIHSPTFDQIMMVISSIPFWIWLYLLIIGYVIWKYKTRGALVIIGVLLCVVICDQITASLMKPFFQRLRPSHDPELLPFIHLVDNYKGGIYGFASSHAANTFTVATFLWLNLRNTEKWPVYMFIWAAVVSYSRIYLGVHYPGDIIVGAFIGILAALLVNWLMRKFVLNTPLETKLSKRFSKRIE